MIIQLLFALLSAVTAYAAETPVSEIEGAELFCHTPGTVVHINKKQERLWLADPGKNEGLEPLITKFLNTGEKSLFVKAEANFSREFVTLFFTMRDYEVRGEVIETGLRATLRIIDSTGEESAVFRFRCKYVVPPGRIELPLP